MPTGNIFLEMKSVIVFSFFVKFEFYIIKIFKQNWMYQENSSQIADQSLKSILQFQFVLFILAKIWCQLETFSSKWNLSSCSVFCQIPKFLYNSHKKRIEYPKISLSAYRAAKRLPRVTSSADRWLTNIYLDCKHVTCIWSQIWEWFHVFPFFFCFGTW